MPRGTRGVRLTLEIPARQALLSQFELWHFVLNQSHLPSGRPEPDGNEMDSIVARISEANLKRSWQNIFDLQFGDEEWFGPHSTRSIQACLPSLRLKDIRNVDFFVAR